MSERCKALHKIVDKCLECRYPIDMKKLPHNGIYFFYERGEMWGHGGSMSRIVHVGTHRNGNFQSRIRDHYTPDTKMSFDAQKPAPHDRSIFRKNIGRAILNRTTATIYRCGTLILQQWRSERDTCTCVTLGLKKTQNWRLQDFSKRIFRSSTFL